MRKTPIPFCTRCAKLRLPAEGHWANDCENTVCRLCLKRRPGHYSYGCPKYTCHICRQTQPGHSKANCPKREEFEAAKNERDKKWIDDFYAKRQSRNIDEDAYDDDMFDIDPSVEDH